MKRIYFPLIALGLGLIGFFLRMQQLSVALSPSTGMPILHHPYSYALIALTIVGVLLLFFLSFFVANEARTGTPPIMQTRLCKGWNFSLLPPFWWGRG